jgi:hypothetical protein
MLGGSPKHLDVINLIQFSYDNFIGPLVSVTIPSKEVVHHESIY